MSSEEIPKGVIPHIQSPDCDKHIEWLKNVFNAEEKELFRKEEKGKVMYCDMSINGGSMLLCDASATCSPAEESKETENATNGHDSEDAEPTAGFLLTVELEDPNVFWEKALANGAKMKADLKTQYWGGVYGLLLDPFGFYWALVKGDKCRKPGVIPYLVTPDGECEKEIEWLKSAFGAEVKGKHMSKDNLTVQHCFLEINGGAVFLGDQSNTPGMPECKKTSKLQVFTAHMNMLDTKPLWDRAIKNGAKTVVELKLHFWGEVYGAVEDPHGYQWAVMEAKPKSQQMNEKRGVLPYIHSPDCTKHIEFVKSVFGGEVREIYHNDSKKVMHCNISVNGGSLFICDRQCKEGKPEKQSAEEPKGFLCHINVADPDMVWKKAMANGATQVMELKKQFWGDYYGTFNDPFGYQWAICKL